MTSARPPGQSLVEFALILPILLFTLLGMAEAAFLFATRHDQQTSADVLADAAAERIASMPGESWRAGWEPIAASERERAGCPDAQVDVAFPDGTSGPGDRVRIDWACAYEPIVTNGLWPGLVVRVQGESVIRSSGSDGLVSS
jgi:hypothetical protein